MATNLKTVVRSESEEVEISRDLPTVMIGERINPTGRKVLQEQLRQGDFTMVRDDALAQVEAGAAILDVNAGVPKADEPVLLVEMIHQVREVTQVPLCIDTANVTALEAALKIYKGKALVNSVNGEEEKLESVLPLIKEYGAAVIGLTLDDDGIPKTVEKRIEIAEKIITRATALGIPIADIVIDPLALTMGAEPDAGKIGLESITAITEKFGVNITMGASNISFGMPDREAINASFLAMAIGCGLTCPITNPLKEQVAMAVLAADLCLGRDEYGSNWIGAFRKRKKAKRA
jgi:5-methyltetrahydrofolate--homocysteine methyltransferase